MQIITPRYVRQTISALAVIFLAAGTFNISIAQKISAGSDHSLLLCTDGTVKAWGDNYYYQLGNSTMSASSLPVVVNGLTGTITAVSAGGSHSMALKSDGTVWAWGYNYDGQLGVVGIPSSDVPVQVTGLTGVIAIAAGYSHSIALKNDGTVWAWGNNGYGQLGDSTNNGTSIPVQAKFLTNITAISAGNYHSMALKNDSTVWTWGSNNYGQLGLGSNSDSISAHKVPGLSKIISIDCGGSFSLALKNTGTIMSWGENYYGQLGDGTQISNNVPIPVLGVANVMAICAGTNHSMALKTDSTVWKWGATLPFPLRTHRTNDLQNTSPMQISGLSGIFAISAGQYHQLAYKNNQTAWGWGNNMNGQIGCGNNSDQVNPVQAHCICGSLYPTVSASADVTICPGTNTTVTGLASGGNGAPFSYVWSPTVNINCTSCANAVINPFVPTTYFITGYDWKMCSALDSVKVDTLAHPSAPIITPSPFPTVCNGNPVSLTASNLSLTFSWMPGGSTATTIVVTPTANTYYKLTTTAGNNCSTTDSLEVKLLNAGISKYDVTTCGGCNGAAYTSVTGGTGPYTYAWSAGGSTTNSYENSLCTGTYSVTITDYNSCSVTDSAKIINPGPLTLPAPTVTNVTCNGADNGTATANPTGGTPSYYYTWNDGGQPQYTQTATGLTPGVTYTVIVTDAAGCSAADTAYVTVTEPTALTTSISANVNVSCNGANNGSATVAANGGTGSYTYLWMPGSKTTQTANNLSPGNYSVTVTDNNGCTASPPSITITQPAILSLALSSSNPTCNGLCNGSATATPGGGTTPYTYVWSPGGETTSAATALCAGTYTLSLTDVNGCNATQTLTLTQPTAVTTTITPTNASCNGMCDGSVIAGASGGTGTYSYTWTPGGNTTSSVGSLCSNTYSLAVSDMNGCMSNKTVTITEPTALTATVSKTDANCNGTCTGTASATPAGGTGAYTYLWFPTSQTTQGASFLCAGTHSVIIADNNGCIKSDTITVGEPLGVPITVTVTPTSCGSFSGTASASVSGPGAVPPFAYLWTTGSTATSINGLDAGVYRANVTDGNGCFGFADANVSSSNGPAVTINTVTPVSCSGLSNGAIDISVTGGTPPYTFSWSNGQTSEDASGLSNGPYEVNVSDATGCIVVKSIYINEPAPLALTYSVINSGCSATNGSASVLVSGGTSPYNYMWTAGGSTSVKSAIGAGIYGVTITDVKGCADSTLIAVQDSGGPVVFVDTIAAANCGSSGYVLLVPMDSASISGYNWSTGNTTQNISGLNPGNYGVVVTDTAGCKSVLIAPVNPVLPPIKPICLVTVDTLSNENIVVWEKPVSTFIAGFNIYRESSQQGTYQKIAYSPYSNVSTYYDPIAQPDIKWARYRISMVDVCGTEGPMSPDHKTMHLSIQSVSASSIDMIWDAYEGYSFSYYRIFRKDSIGASWHFIDSVAAPKHTYSDTTLTYTGDSVSYHIDVDAPNDCNATIIKNPNAMATSVKSSKSNGSDRIASPNSAVHENDNSKNILVYPNPSHGLFTIKDLQHNLQTATVKVYNVLGEGIYQLPNQPVNQLTIDLRGNAKGVYHLQLISGNSVINKKIIVE